MVLLLFARHSAFLPCRRPPRGRTTTFKPFLDNHHIHQTRTRSTNFSGTLEIHNHLHDVVFCPVANHQEGMAALANQDDLDHTNNELKSLVMSSPPRFRLVFCNGSPTHELQVVPMGWCWFGRGAHYKHVPQQHFSTGQEETHAKRSIQYRFTNC